MTGDQEIDKFFRLQMGIEKQGIPFCINCIGLNPEDEFTITELYHRLYNPQRHAFKKLVESGKVIGAYINKSCVMCGRTYDEKGACDETFKLTAHRVKMELDNAGVFGVSDLKVEAIVAECRKSCLILLKNRHLVAHGLRMYKKGDPRLIARCDRMTFAGCLAHIITMAQMARAKKMSIIGGTSATPL